MAEENAKRIGDAERDQAVALLQEHLAAGRLDQEEFDERMTKALSARTNADLLPLFDDLPGERPGQQVVPLARADAVAPPSTEDRLGPRIGQAVIGSLWPIAILACFIFGWHLWWLMLIPMFFTPVLFRLFGVHEEHDRDRRRHPRQDPEGPGRIGGP